MRTISEAIKNYNNNQFQNYYLYGDDIFLERFFINQLSKKFIDNDGSKILYHFGVDDESVFLNDLNSSSLFDSKKMIICWGINKLSKKGKEELLLYISNNPTKDNSLIIISPDFKIKNRFITELSSKLISIDIRTPFPSKMKNWIRFYAKSKNISISNELVDFYIEYFGDDLSSVMNELDKHQMYLLNQKLDISDSYSNYLESNRNFHYWQFLDNIGRKKCYQALNIYQSLISNGISHNYIVFGLTNLFINIYAKNLYLNVDSDFPILNKILQRNIKLYSLTYNLTEATNILQHLYKIDKMVKTFKYGVDYQFEMLILKACDGRK